MTFFDSTSTSVTSTLEAEMRNSCFKYGNNKQKRISEANREKQASTHVETTLDAPENPKNIADYKKLKIALLSTPLLTVPPKNYGGLEVVVADLGRELALLGHDVTIFAPQGSRVEGCKIYEVSLPSLTVFADWLQAEARMFDACKADLILGGYDIIHGHNWFGLEYRAKKIDLQLHVLHTHHGGLVSDWQTHARNLQIKLNMVAISNWMKSVYERQGIPTRVVYNGVNPDKYPLRIEKSNRFLFLSRIAFFKAPHIAIQIAKELNLELDVAGATQFAEDTRYVEEIKKSCDGKQIRFIGEVTNEQKLELMSNAKALIVPACWGEPFGLHIIEAMMTGTGVLAVADGGIKETVNVGGILCEGADELAEIIKVYNSNNIIDPTVCRYNALQFSTKKMCKNYLHLYKDVLAGNEW